MSRWNTDERERDQEGREGRLGERDDRDRGVGARTRQGAGVL